MNARKLLRKWTRRIERLAIGDDANIRRELESAFADCDRWRPSLRLIEYLELGCKLWALATIRRDPTTPREAIERGMLFIWDQLMPAEAAERN